MANLDTIKNETEVLRKAGYRDAKTVRHPESGRWVTQYTIPADGGGSGRLPGETITLYQDIVNGRRENV